MIRASKASTINNQSLFGASRIEFQIIACISEHGRKNRTSARIPELSL